MTDLHTQLRAEIERRLSVATAAEDADWTLDERAEYGPKVGEWSREVDYQVWHCDDEQDGCPGAARSWIAEARHIALHDPADAIRRYEGEMEVLERHYAITAVEGPAEGMSICAACSNGDDQWYYTLAGECPEIRSLARRLGVSVDG